MIGLIEFLFLAAKAYQNARKERVGVSYVARSNNGVPDCCVLVALNREAWRVTDIAIAAAPQHWRQGRPS